MLLGIWGHLSKIGARNALKYMTPISIEAADFSAAISMSFSAIKSVPLSGSSKSRQNSLHTLAVAAPYQDTV